MRIGCERVAEGAVQHESVRATRRRKSLACADTRQCEFLHESVRFVLLLGLRSSLVTFFHFHKAGARRSRYALCFAPQILGAALVEKARDIGAGRVIIKPWR